MNLNKNISIWRGNNTPPSQYHLWLKGDKLYHNNGVEWIENKVDLASLEGDGLMSKEDKEKLDNLVYDGLDSNDGNKALSANQGKILKELLDAKVIEVGAIPLDSEPIEGNTEHIVTSDGIYKSLSKRDEKLSNIEYNIGKVIEVKSLTEGVFKYKFIANHSYKIVNNADRDVTISIRLEPDGESTDIQGLRGNSTLIYTPTHNGNYLRFGDPIDATIEHLDALTPRLSLVEESIEKQNISITENKSKLDSIGLSEIALTESNLYGKYKFEVGKSYVIISLNSTPVTLSTANDIGGEIIEIIGDIGYNEALLFTPTISTKYIKSGDPIVLKIFEKNGVYELNRKPAQKISIINKEVKGYYILTNVAIGTIIDVNSPIQNATCSYMITDCRIGDIFDVQGSQGESPSLWAFIDSDGTLTSRSGMGTSQTNVVSPIDGKLIVQTTDYTRYPVLITKYNVCGLYELEKKFAEVENSIKGYTEHSSETDGTFEYFISAGDIVCIENTSDHDVTFSLRVVKNSTSELIKTISSYSIEEFEADKNYSYIRFGDPVSFKVWKKSEHRIVPRIEDLELKTSNIGNDTPSVKYDFSTEMFDFDDELTDFAFPQASDTNTDFMERLYAKFDALMLSNKDYITKIDAGADVSLPYPSYANGISTESEHQQVTPAYKMYMYKLISNNPHVYSTTFKKKKLLLIGGTHGNEYAAQFNCYLFAKCLCEMKNDDYFKLRSSYDIYIIPCLNGYGIYHQSRANGNWVNINRNYPIAKWHKVGEDKRYDRWDSDYSGDYAGSEFETKVVVGLNNKYKFDVVIDHHNYSVLNWQYYSVVNDKRFRFLTHQSLVDCSRSFIKNKPSYFGTKYRLFQNLNESSPLYIEPNSMGTTCRWGLEAGVPLCSTIEISQCINFINGEFNDSCNDNFGADTFAVGELTLRNTLMRYCEYING